SVSGSVTPGSVEEIELVGGDGKHMVVPVDENGNVKLDGVPTGEYTVVVTPKPGYTAPADQQVTVEKDQDTRLENITPT
ncbi:carboxypeptidase-like regulatory domain-containing protein, partial [Corynebacterium afermentans]|uniref:carboxypeptidase-like regulatory domain-containing protein n=1 Tax=Corynebacterium afermentans TaxID=38286 RepID=UPI002572E2E2